jgi:hypothetical protein
MGEIYHANGMTFRLIQEKDGWWSIYLRNAYTGQYKKQLQAKDREHAEIYCDLCEPVTVPMMRIDDWRP